MSGLDPARLQCLVHIYLYEYQPTFPQKGNELFFSPEVLMARKNLKIIQPGNEKKVRADKFDTDFIF